MTFLTSIGRGARWALAASVLVLIPFAAPTYAATPAQLSSSHLRAASDLPAGLRSALEATLAGEAGGSPASQSLLVDPVFSLLQEVDSDDGGSGDKFGFSFAFSGNTALVGAPYADVDGRSDQGAVYVFTQTGGQWVQTQKLTASDGAGNSIFGYYVAIDGGTAVIGASFASVGSNVGQGAVYVFNESGGSWSEGQKLTASDGMADHEFGTRVAINGDSVFVGATRASVNGVPRQGAVYAFTRTAGQWSQTQKLTSSNGNFFNFFGYSIGIDGDHALIGAPGIEVDGMEAVGSVYAFTRSGGVWGETQILTADDAGDNHNFGYALSLSGGQAIVGAYFARVDGSRQRGAAYVFSQNDELWTQTQKLVASDGSIGHAFGGAVSLDGQTAVIGAPGTNAAYVFTETAGTWSEVEKLTRNTADSFGFLVALHGNTLLVGASAANVNGNPMQGKAYFYRSGPDPRPVASITPAALNLSVEAGATASSVLTIANNGGDPLTFSMAEAARAASVVVLDPRASGDSRTALAQLGGSQVTMPVSARDQAPWLPRGSDGELTFVLDDGSYENAAGLSGGGVEFAAIWLNRFSPPPGTGAFTLNTISILWPQNQNGSLVGQQVNLVAYFDADRDGNPANAIRLGGDHPITIASLDTYIDYTVNFAVPGNGDIYIGFENSYARGGSSPVLYAAALDQDPPRHARSWVASTQGANPDLNVLGNNDLLGVIDSFGLAGNFLIRGTGIDAAGAADCLLPSDVSWLSQTPSSGSVTGGTAQDVIVAVDASALAAGDYSALLCISTNDANHALVQVPVNVTVTASDVIFRDGFDATP